MVRPSNDDDLAVLRTAGIAGRADIVLAALAALELQFLQFGAVGEIHHHAAVGPAIDDHRLAALGACRGLGAGPVVVVVIGAVAPAADQFLRPVL